MTQQSHSTPPEPNKVSAKSPEKKSPTPLSTEELLDSLTQPCSQIEVDPSRESLEEFIQRQLKQASQEKEHRPNG